MKIWSSHLLARHDDNDINYDDDNDDDNTRNYDDNENDNNNNNNDNNRFVRVHGFLIDRSVW